MNETRGPAPVTLPHRLKGAAATAFAAVSICGCAAPDGAFVRAERATYEAVAPEYLGYVAADSGLTEEQKARRRRTVRTWDLSIRQHEPRPQGAGQ